MALRIRLAENAADLDALFRLRHRVYAEEKQWMAPRPDGRVVDRFDAFPDTANLVAGVDGEVVGGLRFVEAGPAGTPAESWFDFSPYLPPNARPASAGLLCLEPHLRRTPGIVSSMIGMGYHWALSRGITHLLAPFNPDVAPAFLQSGGRQVAPEFIHEETGLPVLPAIFDLAELDEPFLSFARRQGIDHFLASYERQFQWAGETVMRRGGTGTAAFVVVDGEVAVLVGDEGHPVEVARLGRGEVVGELALLTGRPHSADVVAVTDVDLMVVNQDVFRAQLRCDAGLRLLEVLGNRLAELDELVARQHVQGGAFPTTNGHTSVAPRITSSTTV